MMPEDVLERLVEECHEDHVGLWRIVNAVRFDLNAADPRQTHALALRQREAAQQAQPSKYPGTDKDQ